MFSGKFSERLLQEREVTGRVVSDINDLLKMQHGDANPITKESLLARMKRMHVAVSWSDERVVGLGVLIRVEGLNFVWAEIRHFVIAAGLNNRLAIGMGIVNVLCGACPQGVEFIDGGVWVQDPEMIKILTALGFREKPCSRYRLRIIKSARDTRRRKPARTQATR